MELIIKQLKQNNQIIVPRTTAEAVLVNTNSQVQRLDQVLDRKIEAVITPLGSGLSYIPSGKSVIIQHSNSIDPIDEVKPLLIKHDNRGHIIETKPLGKLTVVVNNTKHIEVDGTEDKVLSLGDDFKLDNNIIGLNWNNINGTT